MKNIRESGKLGINKDGIYGESLLHKLLKKQGYKNLMQVDMVGYKNGKWWLFECKRQEYFKAPPFDGHGLTTYQVISRLRFQKDTGVIGVLVVFEKNNEDIVYMKDIVELEKGKKHTTEKHPRRIYPLTSFDKISLKDKKIDCGLDDFMGGDE